MPHNTPPNAGRDLRHDFQTTHWSAVLLAAQSLSGVESQRALDMLCRVYWFPLYAFVRSHSIAHHQAEDIVQDFLLRMQDKKILRAVTPGQGKFRSFMLACMKNHLLDAIKYQSAQKRGGGKIESPWHEVEAEAMLKGELVHNRPPEHVFDRQWVLTMIRRVSAQMGETFQHDLLAYADIEPYVLLQSDAPSFADQAKATGVTEAALKSIVHKARKRFQQLFRNEILRTVESPEEADEEIAYLFSILQ